MNYFRNMGNSIDQYRKAIGSFVSRCRSVGPSQKAKWRKIKEEDILKDNRSKDTSETLNREGLEACNSFILALLSLFTAITVVSALPVIKLLQPYLSDLLQDNIHLLTIYCGQSGGLDTQGGNVNCSYSLIVRMLLLVFGVEQNPGPSSDYIFTLCNLVYQTKDSRQIVIICSDTTVTSRLSALIHYSPLVDQLIRITGSCRYNLYFTLDFQKYIKYRSLKSIVHSL